MMALLLVAALLGGWELYADVGGVDDFILPAPSQIATVDVPLERPRHRTDAEVVALREQALTALGGER